MPINEVKLARSHANLFIYCNLQKEEKVFRECSNKLVFSDFFMLIKKINIENFFPDFFMSIKKNWNFSAFFMSLKKKNFFQISSCISDFFLLKHVIPIKWITNHGKRGVVHQTLKQLCLAGHQLMY